MAKKEDPFFFERMGSPDSFMCWKRGGRDGGRNLGLVFRKPGSKREWYVNVSPYKHVQAVIQGEPIIGTIRGPYPSKRKAALYLLELGEQA